MAFLDVQSSSTPQSLPLLLFSHREGGGRGAGDPGAPAVVPAPASAPRPASSPARSETRSPPLTLISRHITCCSCESPGDVLLSGGGGGGSGWGVGGPRYPRVPTAAPAPILAGRPQFPSRDGWRWSPPPHPHCSPRFAPRSPQAPGATGGPGRPRGRVSAAAAERDRDQPSARRPATLLDHRAPSPSAPHCGQLPAPGFPSLHSRACFTILTEETARQRCPGGARGAPRRPGGGGVGVGFPGPAPPRSVSEANGRVSPTRAVPSPRGPRSASRWGE